MSDMTWNGPGAWEWRCQEFDRGPRPPRCRPDDSRSLDAQTREVAEGAMEAMFSASAGELSEAAVEVKDPDERVTEWECTVESVPVFVARPMRKARLTGD